MEMDTRTQIESIKKENAALKRQITKLNSSLKEIDAFERKMDINKA